jgi:hypothetical protein
MRFSIRDLLWLMVVAAILTAWWVDHGQQAVTIQKQIEISRTDAIDAQKWRQVVRRKPTPVYRTGDFNTPPPALEKSLQMDRSPEFRTIPTTP